ncbi:MAG: response regulator [Campylobacteraceae bacterium]|nr:response regulator [Campylobacteraceae bacterium]
MVLNLALYLKRKKMITRVLLVEDEIDALEILAFYLNTVFDEVSCASNGEEGLLLYEEAQKDNKCFDLVISDIKMPKKDGMTMIEDISKLNENQKFIIVSAHKDEEFLFKSISLNVVSYFVKPLDIKKIMEILKKVKIKVLEEKEDTIVLINNTFSYNKNNSILFNKKEIINLSKKEILLIEALLLNIKIIKTKENLKEFVWKDNKSSDATLRTLIKRVKDKISDDDFIVSKKGLGYIIE